MLKPIIQNDGITDRERYLATLARSRLFRLWSYPGLSRRESDGRSQELADLTVVFGDDVLLFSDKDEAWSDHPDVEVAWKRWHRRAIEKSARQLWGAERYLRQFPDGIYLDARLTEPFPFPLVTDCTRIHLIAVTANSDKAAQKFFDAVAPGSSSTLMFHYAGTGDDTPLPPFVVGDLDPGRTFVHVFDQQTLDLVLQELGTIADLLHYLTEKARVIREGHLGQVAGEEELLAFYLEERGPDGFGALPFDKKAFGGPVLLPEGQWRAFKASQYHRVHASRLRNSEWWNTVLGLFDESVINANTGEANDVELALHERALRVAASENTASRARLSTAFSTKYASVPAGVRSSAIARSCCVPGRIYALVLVPFDPAVGSYADYRAYRRSLVEAYATVLPLKVKGVREAIIIGAQTQGRHGDSEVMVYHAYDQPLDDAFIREAQGLMVDEKILADVPEVSVELPAGWNTRGLVYGRNDPCPCDSGRKNKKCCSIVGPLNPPTWGFAFGG